MKSISHESEIKNTLSNLRMLSFHEKKIIFLDEERINLFLDAVLEFKNMITVKTKKIDDVNKQLEKLTWLDDLDEDCLMLINDLISSAKDLHSSLIRQHGLMNILVKKGISKKEISDFKNTVDELKEVYEDLESVFFFLPKNPDFVETTKQLSLI